MQCPVCFEQYARDLDDAVSGVPVADCRRCGKFKYTAHAVQTLRNAPREKRALVCGWLWEQGRFGSVPTIDERNVDTLLSAAPLPFFEKEKRLLIYLADQSRHFGKPADLTSLHLEAMVETLDHRNVLFLAEALGEGQLLKYKDSGWIVTGPGYMQAESWKQTANSSDQCFVAMWFDNDLTAAWENGFRPAIKKAGYKPLRIDQKHHLNKICDEIIAEIRRSKFVVADYTGHRGGVYYEAGYAAGRGLPVVPTCKKDDMDKLHFDIRQYNCIDWGSPEDLADRLQARLEQCSAMVHINARPQTRPDRRPRRSPWFSAGPWQVCDR